MKIAVTGKGGVGKTTFAATLARLYADEGRKVLAADVDPDANLGLALGFDDETLDSIVPITKMRKLVEERTGANEENQFYRINPKVDDIPDTYSKEVNGVKLLVLGTVETGGGGCVCPETRMNVYERQPYSGKLVFAAFSGSHQDAIAKGMHWIDDRHPDYWSVPYLPIDPKDIGREYESDVIRINSQSGKGGIGYVLEENFGFHIPGKMREDVGYTVKDVSDKQHRELVPKDILDVFKTVYVNISSPIALKECHFIQKDGGIEAEISLEKSGVDKLYHGRGNGRLDAVSNALQRHSDLDYSIVFLLLLLCLLP